MVKGNLLYAQSGGVTAVINATACAVIETARRKGVSVLAAKNGIIGALREELIDTSKETPSAIAALRLARGDCPVPADPPPGENRPVFRG